MPLFAQPELLSVEDHGSLGLVTPARPFDFAANATALPLTGREFTSAQKHYPIVFSDLENPVPVAVTGIAERNLFVTGSGRWEAHCYIPAYLRCYPFAVASAPDEKAAAVIDRASAQIAATPDHAFFVGNQLTDDTRERVELCARYEAERRQTLAFGRRLHELGLLAAQQVMRRKPGGDEERMAGYVAVDAARLQKLAPDVLHGLFADGSLSVIFAHLFSLENWQRLIERNAVPPTH